MGTGPPSPIALPPLRASNAAAAAHTVRPSPGAAEGKGCGRSPGQKQPDLGFLTPGEERSKCECLQALGWWPLLDAALRNLGESKAAATKEDL